MFSSALRMEGMEEMKRIPKSIQREVSESSGTNVVAWASQIEAQVVELSTPLTNGEKMNLTESRKVKKVAYEVTFPDPEKITPTPDQIAIAVKAFVKARVGYLLRENVKKEAPTIEAFMQSYKMCTAINAKRHKDWSPEENHKNTVEDLKEIDPNFRLEPTKSFFISLEEIFKSDETEEAEEKDEKETEEKAAE